MPVHTVALSLGLDAQRRALRESQRALETGVEVQTNLLRTTLESLEHHERFQRRLLALQHVLTHRLGERADERTSGFEPVTDAALDGADAQFEQLYASHRELFAYLNDDCEQCIEACETVSGEYLDAVDELTELVLTATEAYESHVIAGANEHESDVVAD